MNSSARQRLLEDALLPGALADSLATTRRAARHQRFRRRALPFATTAAAIAVAAAWFLRQQVEPVLETPVVATAPARTFVLVTTATRTAAPVVRTAAAPAALIVCTRDTASPTPRANEDELFALAGSRPAALHRLPDGSERWMWLDEKRSF